MKSTVEKIEKTPAAEKTVKAVKKATETVAAKAPEVVEEVKNTVKNHKISGITLEIFETSITVADLEAAVKKDAGIATGAVGLIKTAKQAEEILQNEQADLIFVAREILRNPYLPVRGSFKNKDNCFFPPQYERARP